MLGSISYQALQLVCLCYVLLYSIFKAHFSKETKETGEIMGYVSTLKANSKHR